MSSGGWDSWGKAGSDLAGGIFGLFGKREDTAARIAEAQIAGQAAVASAEVANANARAMFGLTASQQNQTLIVGALVIVGLVFLFRARDVRG